MDFNAKKFVQYNKNEATYLGFLKNSIDKDSEVFFMLN
jgi:hypothetical protein